MLASVCSQLTFLRFARSDIIKLTAQFVARNGRSFLTMLQQREANNKQFDFLKPNHALFSYFQSLVAAYVQVVIVRPETLTQLTEASISTTRIVFSH